MFDPSIGRWISEDPSGIQPDENLFRYCGNNPTNETDPTGLQPPVIKRQEKLEASLLEQLKFEKQTEAEAKAYVVKGFPSLNGQYRIIGANDFTVKGGAEEQGTNCMGFIAGLRYSEAKKEGLSRLVELDWALDKASGRFKHTRWDRRLACPDRLDACRTG